MLISNDGGDNFQYSSTLEITDQTEPFSNIYVLDNSNSIIGTATEGYLYYSNNGGQDYTDIISLSIENANNGIYISPLLNVESTPDISRNVVSNPDFKEKIDIEFDMSSPRNTTGATDYSGRNPNAGNNQSFCTAAKGKKGGSCLKP